MEEKELIRKALLGDKQAQEECTAKGIVLPCPFCGEEAQLISEKGLYTIVCKDGPCIGSDIHPEYGEAMFAAASNQGRNSCGAKNNLPRGRQEYRENYSLPNRDGSNRRAGFKT